MQRGGRINASDPFYNGERERVMAVITVSRGTFSGGKILAECLAEKLGYRCIDRDVIVEKAAGGRVSQEDLRQAMTKPPSFLDRFRRTRYLYLALLQAALTEEVRRGDVVYHGNAGHLLLKGGCSVLRLRIIAPLELRIRMAQGRSDLSREQAVAYIARVDEERRKWTAYLYGVDWRDPSLYDLVLNLESMGMEEACNVAAEAAQRKSFEYTAECQKKMDDLALASKVRATLATDRTTAHLELEVEAKEGTVWIRGRAHEMSDADEADRVASMVEGVREVNVDGLVSVVRL
jgi:cytidylate kinase